MTLRDWFTKVIIRGIIADMLCNAWCEVKYWLDILHVKNEAIAELFESVTKLFEVYLSIRH